MTIMVCKGGPTVSLSFAYVKTRHEGNLGSRLTMRDEIPYKELL